MTLLPIVVVSAVVVALAAIAAHRGRWRRALGLFAIRPARMTVQRLGLAVHARDDAERVDTILRSFAGGFNRMLTARTAGEALADCDALPPLYRPFAHEGLAMGYTPRKLMRFRGAEFEKEVVKPRPEFRYLYYVGLGFWSGMRNHAPTLVQRRVQDLDALHRYLCFDGYGFKVAFFDHPRDAGALSRLERFSGYAKNAAFHGVGRALWFRYLDDAPRLIAALRALGEGAFDAAAGVGLAATFVFPDRLEKAAALAEQMPPAWHPHLHLGMCFALKARSINDVDAFENHLARVPQGMREAARASIRECDRVELLVRADDQEDKYRRWRERVTAWMLKHVEFPLAGVRALLPADSRHKAVQSSNAE